MGTPEANPKGYESSSPLRKAAALEADLLLIHGASDDNVHLGQHAVVRGGAREGRQALRAAGPPGPASRLPPEGRPHRPGPRRARPLRADAAARHALAARAGPRNHLQLAAEGRLEARAQAAHAPRGQRGHAHRHLAAAHAAASAERAPGGVRSVISSASASSTAARSSGSSSSGVTSGASERPGRSSSSPAWLTTAASSATCAVREAGQVRREHQVGDVLVAIEEVHRAPDVEDAGRLQRGRLRSSSAGPGSSAS